MPNTAANIALGVLLLLGVVWGLWYGRKNTHFPAGHLFWSNLLAGICCLLTSYGFQRVLKDENPWGKPTLAMVYFPLVGVSAETGRWLQRRQKQAP